MSEHKHIFLSSTYEDLIDLRSELLHHLTSLGFSVLTSAGTSIESRNSVETSLSNVRSCDYAIFVLSQRYGQTLAAIDYGERSLVQLEYEEAVKGECPVFVYVRNHLDGDYRITKGGQKAEWVPEGHRPLFSFMASLPDYRVFDNSVTLKQMIVADLGKAAAKLGVERAIRENRIPIIKIEPLLQSVGNQTELHCNYKNLGSVPAYNVFVECSDKATNTHFRGEVNPVIAPNDSSRLVSVLDAKSPSSEIVRKFVIRYQAPEGFTIKDTFLFSVTHDKAGNTSTMLRRSGRSYSFSDEAPYILEDPS